MTGYPSKGGPADEDKSKKNLNNIDDRCNGFVGDCDSLFYIAALDEVWGLLAFVLIVPYFAPFLIGILAILGCVRSLLSEKQTGELRRLSCSSLMLVLRHRDGIEIRMRRCFLHKANEDRSLL